jgi:hypothetical protein
MKVTKSRKIPKKKAPTVKAKVKISRHYKYLAKNTAYKEEQRLSSKIPPEVEAKLAAEKMVELYNSVLREVEVLEQVVQKYRDLFHNSLPINKGAYIKIKEFDKGWIPIPKFEKPNL